MKRPVPVESASRLIDEKIKELGDWRGKSGQPAEARGAEQAGEDGPEQTCLAGPSGPYWTMTGNGGIAEVLQNVGVPGGI